MELPSTNSRLARGVQYAEQSWLPVNAEVLSSLREGIHSKRYHDNHDEFVRDLSRDPALFLLCLKRRAQQEATRETTKPEPWHSPESLLGEDSFDDLEKLLLSSFEVSSAHRLSAASPEQSVSLAQASLSAAVSSELAKVNHIPEVLATTTSFLRNLGLMLIAWNYPHIFKRVMASREPDTSLDQSFGLLLGFSPTVLGISFARSWSLSPDVRMAMGDAAAAELASPLLAAQGTQLEEICRTGDAFARAMFPEQFSSSSLDWHQAGTEIRQALGPQGLSVVARAARDYLRAYATSQPDLFKFPERLGQEPAGDPSNAQEILARNRYVGLCPPSTKRALEEVYSLLQSDSVSRIPLEQLITVTIPKAGFERGCIYLFDPEFSCLRPRVGIGGVSVNGLAPLSCKTLDGDHRHPVVEAFLSGIPQEFLQSVVDGTPCDALAGGLGALQKTGVIYLETTAEISPQVRMTIFKAVRQTLNDVLRIG